jgi:outer membrane protein TolC
MFSKRIAVWALAGALAATSEAQVEEELPLHGAPAGAFAGSLTREGLIAGVLGRNPTLRALCSEVRAAGERGAQSSALEDPMLSWRVAPLSIGSSDVDYGQELHFSQRLPYPGRRGLARQASDAEAEGLARGYQAAGADLVLEALLLFDDLWETDRAIELNAEHAELLGDLQRIATARYAAGVASQQDPLQAEVEVAHREHEAMVLRSRREVLRAGINALLHLPPRAQLPPPALEPIRTAPLPDEEHALFEEALAARPEIRRLDAIRRARDAELDLAALERRPMFEVNASYNSMWAMTEHQWMAGAGVTLPLRGARIRAGIAEAEARLAAVKSSREAAVDRVRLEVATAVERLREAHHVLDLNRDRLLPAARDRQRAALAGFESGANDFSAVIAAERELREAQMDDYEARAGIDRRQADLDRALGRLPAASGCDQPRGYEGDSDEL